MDIEIRLKQILKQQGWYHHGSVTEIAEYCGVHRHSIGRLMRNDSAQPSLRLLGKICDYLVAKGYKAKQLPQDLFGVRASALWRAIAAPGRVCVYVARYWEKVNESTVIRKWVAHSDATVLTKIAEKLSRQTALEDVPTTVETEYIPFEFTLKAGQKQLLEGQEAAKDVYEKIRNRVTPETSILLGSQRANYLVEYFVSDLFHTKAFEPPKGTEIRVPFYTRYREIDRMVRSCFGGRGAPPGYRGRATPGVYYLNEDGAWEVAEWVEQERDAGVLILVREPASTSLVIAAFGFSGRGTEGIGEQMVKGAEEFWRPGIKAEGREVAAYVCRFEFQKDAKAKEGNGLIAKSTRFTPVSNKVLKKYLTEGGREEKR